MSTPMPAAAPRPAGAEGEDRPPGAELRIPAEFRSDPPLMSRAAPCLRTLDPRLDDVVSRVFSDSGPLAASLDSYRPRQVQIEMASAVSSAIETQDVLVCEAGTGTGKTLAYLVPALLSGRRTIISTGTRNLQDQLFGRDLPLARKALATDARCALLKGRSNYLCRERLRRSLAGSRHVDPVFAPDLATIGDWARHTVEGDIAEMTEIPESAPVWRHATSTADNCLGPECPSYTECHVHRARRNAIQADILVVNHHLFFADMVLREEGFGELLPGAEAVVLDEAHQLAETATRFFGTTHSSAQTAELLRDAAHAHREEAGDQPALVELSGECGLALEALRHALGEPGQRLTWSEASASPAVERASQRLRASLRALSEALEPMAERGAALQNCAQRAALAASRLAFVTRAEEEPDPVRWVETHRFGFTLHASPLDVAPMMSERIYAAPCAWVFTSATLAVEGRLAHFAQRLGLDEAVAHVWASPFDFERQALCYLPPGLPDPRAPDYRTALLEELVPVLEATCGRAFVLFTSFRALNAISERLPERIPYPVLVQGSAPRRELLARFRSLPNAVLLATHSFWEGVDVRGEALSCVVIDKLPFAAPDDPVLRARIRFLREQGRDPFMSYQLPHAVLALKQGVGRLIRDPEDRGVVVLCDPRVLRKGYGRAFLDSLPPMPRTRERAEIRRFFERGGAAGPSR